MSEDQSPGEAGTDTQDTGGDGGEEEKSGSLPGPFSEAHHQEYDDATAYEETAMYIFSQRLRDKGIKDPKRPRELGRLRRHHKTLPFIEEPKRLEPAGLSDSQLLSRVGRVRGPRAPTLPLLAPRHRSDGSPGRTLGSNRSEERKAIQLLPQDPGNKTKDLWEDTRKTKVDPYIPSSVTDGLSEDEDQGTNEDEVEEERRLTDKPSEESIAIPGVYNHSSSRYLDKRRGPRDPILVDLLHNMEAEIQDEVTVMEKTSDQPFSVQDPVVYRRDKEYFPAGGTLSPDAKLVCNDNTAKDGTRQKVGSNRSCEGTWSANKLSNLAFPQRDKTHLTRQEVRNWRNDEIPYNEMYVKSERRSQKGARERRFGSQNRNISNWQVKDTVLVPVYSLTQDDKAKKKEVENRTHDTNEPKPEEYLSRVWLVREHEKHRAPENDGNVSVELEHGTRQTQVALRKSESDSILLRIPEAGIQNAEKAGKPKPHNTRKEYRKEKGQIDEIQSDFPGRRQRAEEETANGGFPSGNERVPERREGHALVVKNKDKNGGQETRPEREQESGIKERRQPSIANTPLLTKVIEFEQTTRSRKGMDNFGRKSRQNEDPIPPEKTVLQLSGQNQARGTTNTQTKNNDIQRNLAEVEKTKDTKTSQPDDHPHSVQSLVSLQDDSSKTYVIVSRPSSGIVMGVLAMKESDSETDQGKNQQAESQSQRDEEKADMEMYLPVRLGHQMDKIQEFLNEFIISRTQEDGLSYEASPESWSRPPRLREHCPVDHHHRRRRPPRRSSKQFQMPALVYCCWVVAEEGGDIPGPAGGGAVFRKRWALCLEALFNGAPHKEPRSANQDEGPDGGQPSELRDKVDGIQERAEVDSAARKLTSGDGAGHRRHSEAIWIRRTRPRSAKKKDQWTDTCRTRVITKTQTSSTQETKSNSSVVSEMVAVTREIRQLHSDRNQEEVIGKHTVHSISPRTSIKNMIEQLGNPRVKFDQTWRTRSRQESWRRSSQKQDSHEDGIQKISSVRSKQEQRTGNVETKPERSGKEATEWNRHASVPTVTDVVQRRDGNTFTTRRGSFRGRAAERRSLWRTLCGCCTSERNERRTRLSL